MVFNATFNNISVISWQSVLLFEKAWVHGENHRPVCRYKINKNHPWALTWPLDFSSINKIDFQNINNFQNVNWIIQLHVCIFADFHCKPSLLRPTIHGGSRYSKELENLQKRLHFPEEVAIMLTNVEHGLFNSILPSHYIRQVTTDLTRGSTVYRKNSSVEDLIQRFNEVQWIFYEVWFLLSS